MNLPNLENLEVEGKRVIVRVDLDVGEELEEGDDIKLKTLIPTLDYLLEKNCKIVLIGHRGRPEGRCDEKLSLAPVSKRLSELMRREIKFIDQVVGEEVSRVADQLQNGEILILENLRFDPREEENDEEFAKELASYGDIYVNEAFSSSAKSHASIVRIPKILGSVCVGFHFQKEVENLERVSEKPERPLVAVIGGVKEDKLKYIKPFKQFADRILIGGRLPEYIEKKSIDEKSTLSGEKVIVARLNPDKEDITVHSIEAFEQEIESAKTIVLSGPMGRYEEDGQTLGTKRVFGAIANSTAFKLAGGGDTQQAIEKFGLMDKFDWISVGGGATLEYLANGTLPGIEVLEKD